MKKLKIFFNRIILITSIPSLLLVVSCSGGRKIEDYRKFIMEHTIGLMTANTTDGSTPTTASEDCMSTAWLYKQEGKKGYTWYLGTNWHVEYLLKTNLKAGGDTKQLWYTYETNDRHPSYRWTTDATHPSSYQIIPKENYSLADWNGCYLEQNTTYQTGKIIDLGIDFAIIKIDFSEVVKKDNVFKKRLDHLSDIKFYKGDENKTFNNEIYLGGFPKTSFWDTDNLHFTMFNFNVITLFKYQQLNYGQNPISQESEPNAWQHPIFGADGQGRGFKRSAANVYIGNDFQGNSNAGSSGSLCINNKFEVVGIFFGSFGNGSTIINECTAIDLLITHHESYYGVNGYNVFDLYNEGKWIIDNY